MALIDRVHDAGRVITPLGNKSDVLQKEVQKLKAGGDPDVVATAKQRASKAQSLANHLKTELDEATRQWESLDKELSETQETLSSQGRSAEVGHRGLQEVARVRDGPGPDGPSFPQVWLSVGIGSVPGWYPSSR
ncbi:hypothetical protein B296_00042656 [Ensete ventricosum]|uniref:Uncharacterized protein n=1 Tax=Ensete ventricosum TaxID=4639 RepID=A0A426ZHQ9_ENSVE|nr:hypothetical protein B296_00042656 [Ensete ventricosum]